MLSDDKAGGVGQLDAAGSVSVSGANVGDALVALMDFQTPPPVVPTYTVLLFDGSVAMAVMRPLIAPKRAVVTDEGPIELQGAVSGVVLLSAACWEARTFEQLGRAFGLLADAALLKKLFGSLRGIQRLPRLLRGETAACCQRRSP